jgi:7-carboxy-7-deazaguanine synthase
MMRFAVNEIFATIQGEGRWTGTPSIFIRMQGCPVGCGWCDTKQTWALDPEDMVDTIGDASVGEDQHWASVQSAALIAHVKKEAGDRIRHAVITGGEPLTIPRLDLIVDLLLKEGYTVQIETSGCFEGCMFLQKLGAWITLSPKIAMPGGYEVLLESVNAANEIKFPVGKNNDLLKLLALIRENDFGPKERIWIQPLSQSKKATNICIDACLTHGWNLSIQTHKYIDIP